MQVLTGPSLSSTTGVTIQGSSVNLDGAFSPQSSYAVTVSENTFSGYVPAESAVLIVVNLS
jgi:hypothetical protein